MPRTISQGESLITNPYDIANIFNKYFSSVADTAKENSKYSHKHFSGFLNNQCNNSMFIQPTDSEEIANIISTFNMNKSNGPNIPYKILYLLKKDISEQLAYLFNLSLSSGVFPSLLKIAKVVPVHKNDSKLDCRNYRPISLLSNIEKIFEKLMYKLVYQFLTENSIYDFQFGFRQNFSKAHALINLTENIRQALGEGYIGCGIFLDLQKAFGTVDHEIILAKLNHYGIRGVSNDWFRSYFSDRQQYVSINGYDSGLTKLNYGVPQGSVLVPYFFCYIPMTLIKP